MVVGDGRLCHGAAGCVPHTCSPIGAPRYGGLSAQHGRGAAAQQGPRWFGGDGGPPRLIWDALGGQSRVLPRQDSSSSWVSDFACASRRDPSAQPVQTGHWSNGWRKLSGPCTRQRTLSWVSGARIRRVGDGMCPSGGMGVVPGAEQGRTLTRVGGLGGRRGQSSTRLIVQHGRRVPGGHLSARRGGKEAATSSSVRSRLAWGT